MATIIEIFESFGPVLSAREQEVIQLRFGFGREQPLEPHKKELTGISKNGSPLLAIAHHYDVTTERVRQILNKAIRKIKYGDHSKKLIAFALDEAEPSQDVVEFIKVVFPYRRELLSKLSDPSFMGGLVPELVERVVQLCFPNPDEEMAGEQARRPRRLPSTSNLFWDPSPGKRG